MYGLSNFSDVLQLLHCAVSKPQADICKTWFWALIRCVLSMSQKYYAVKREAWVNRLGRFENWQHFLHGWKQHAASTYYDTY